MTLDLITKLFEVLASEQERLGVEWRDDAIPNLGGVFAEVDGQPHTATTFLEFLRNVRKNDPNATELRHTLIPECEGNPCRALTISSDGVALWFGSPT
jgi:hypothetical protein